MIKFSESTQEFYSLKYVYQNLPSDLVEVPATDHLILLEKIITGHHVFSDLTHSEKRPSSSCIWENNGWVETLTEAQKYEQYLKSLRALTRRQFKLILLEHGLLTTIDTAIASIEDAEMKAYVEIEYTESTHFERLSPSVIYMCQLLDLDDEQVNQMWEVALEF